ncbi:hypothetical protein Hypma_015656 [Hypsizygus marmoreus]|uniref:F-box domain-containing protein n=1 Tax=Hypsizygus marmoreus TaxID=39966 RepID=A0A369K3N7_HYPMA|nr:hypothetical protein Hypma_015656 [Hypsizygus marmoreus]
MMSTIMHATYLLAPSLLVSAMPLTTYWPVSRSGSASLKRDRVTEDPFYNMEVRISKKRKMVRFSDEVIKGPSILDTPNEIILAILEELSDTCLIRMAGVCRRIRPVAISVYFRHLQILTSGSGSQELRLCRDVPLPVFLLLSSLHFEGKVAFTCNLFFLMQYQSAVREFSLRTSIVSISIHLYNNNSAILATPGAARALRSFLASLSMQCRSITVEMNRYPTFPARQVSQPEEEHRGRIADEDDIRSLMSNVRSVTLTEDVFRTRSLAQVGFLLLEGPHVEDFGLTCLSVQRNKCSTILSRIKFPALRSLRISSTVIPQIPVQFFRLHSSLNSLALFGRDTDSQQNPARSSRSSSRCSIELPRLRFLTFTDRFIPWVSVLSCPNLKNVSIYPTRYWEEGRLGDSWAGLCASFNAITSRDMSGECLTITTPDDDDETIQDHFYNLGSEALVLPLVPRTHKLVFHLSDLKKASFEIVMQWSRALPNLRTLELLVHSGSADSPDPSESEVQPFLRELRRSLPEFDTLHCGTGTWRYRNEYWVPE